MRLIHTADWHLCKKLGRIDRTQDLRDRVERVAGLCDSHNADGSTRKSSSSTIVRCLEGAAVDIGASISADHAKA